MSRGGGAERERIVVTGSSGRIGTRVMRGLLQGGRYEAIGLDVRPSPDDALRGSAVHCDLTDVRSVRAALQEVRQRGGGAIASVVHLAAHRDASGASSSLYRELTVEGTRRLLGELRGFHVGQLCYASRLLAPWAARCAAEPAERAEACDARARREAEVLLLREPGGVPRVVLRLGSLYDESASPAALARPIRRVRERRLESLLHSGDADRGLPSLHLDDAAEAVLCVVERRGKLDGSLVLDLAEREIASGAELQRRIAGRLYGPGPGAWLAALLAGLASHAPRGRAERRDAPSELWSVDLADAELAASLERTRECLDWEPRSRLLDAIESIVDRIDRAPTDARGRGRESRHDRAG